MKMTNTGKCKVTGCKMGFYCKGYCRRHYRRMLHNGTTELKRVNHPGRVLKRNRVIVLKKARGKCEICDDRANAVHHRNFSHSSHNVSNLMAICNSCHSTIHVDNLEKRSGYRKQYGMNSIELAQLLSVSQSRVSQLHTAGTLHERIANNKILGEKHDSKYRRLYGLTMKEISEKTGIAMHNIGVLYKTKALASALGPVRIEE